VTAVVVTTIGVKSSPRVTTLRLRPSPIGAAIEVKVKVETHAVKSLNRRLGGPQSRRACLRKEKNLLSLPGIELQGGSVPRCLLSELLATYRTFTIKVVQVINPNFLGNEGESCTEV